MLVPRPSKSLCGSCQRRLFSLFANGFCSTTGPSQHSRKHIYTFIAFEQVRRPRSFHVTTKRWEGDPITKRQTPEDGSDVKTTKSIGEMETVVRQARQTFGETLPADLLSSDEYNIYVRLYGPPLRETLPEDVELLKEEDPDEDVDIPRNALLRENEEGSLEEVKYEDEPALDGDEDSALDEYGLATGRGDEAKAQEALYRDIAAATSPQALEEIDSRAAENVFKAARGDVLEAEDDRETDDYYEDEDTLRTHPLTLAGRFGTSPATLQLDKATFVDPITSILADSSNKHLIEIAQKTFGGRGLPNSTATLSTKRHLQQQTIALEASQPKMGEMEANAYLAAIMPGAYATITSTLVETRKRLGSGWLSNLVKKPGGPRILDAGAGGAGVLAWREVIRAELESIHLDDVSKAGLSSLGKATVITGSAELRRRASLLLENTTFLPRLPDYSPERDLEASKNESAPPRKQYDIIIAPYTLWTLREDYTRKAQVQNLWSLLNPNGGVLILIEKGVPRGFELIAGARETLLKNHISSPTSTDIETEIQSPTENRFMTKERGMIIAPCTNHARCPMYTIPGQSKGRKDHCHFSQRYIRPQYLQRILGSKDRNHEDIRFSYIAVQRGRDKRQDHGIEQGHTATEAALEGHDRAAFASTEDRDSAPTIPEPRSDPSQPLMLALPRAILPPLKRRGHIILDLCTPSGTLERWTVPRSFGKQAYRDARKSRWGDLWALGAKQRILRTARAGIGKELKGKKERKMVRDVLEDEEEEDEDDEGRTRVRRKARGKPQNNRERKEEKRRRRLMELKEKEF